MDYEYTIDQHLVQIARLALTGSQQDVALYLRRIERKLCLTNPTLAAQIETLLAESPSLRQNPLRDISEPFVATPVDIDSRLQLVRRENPVALEVEPIYSDEIRSKLEQLVAERVRLQDLVGAGLAPTRTVLLKGPPGVGKTLAARWISSKLKLPLVILDLSAVMSSFLGRTGANIRHVLDYAKSTNCVLFLDEFDAIAKRRDDDTDIGELKRLVTVLLQEIDNWPQDRLLVAATNLPEILDPAVWRRFDMVIDFGMPALEQMRELTSRILEPLKVTPEMRDIVCSVFEGASFSDIERALSQAHREAIVLRQPIEDRLVRALRGRMENLDSRGRIGLAAKLVDCGFSQHEAHDWTGVSRDTIRKAIRNGNGTKKGARA